jgi:hypothetical protein
LTLRLRTVALATAALVLVCAPPLAAQPVSLTPEPAAGERGLLPRYRFYLDAERLIADDPRFDWDAEVGGDLDFVDYGAGRITAMANIETVLGHELRRFDPNQANYTLDVSASARRRALEVALAFHHISRHLSDRAKEFPIDWNMLGVRGSYEYVRGRTRAQIDGRALFTVTRSFVDYTSEIGGGVALRRDVSPRVALVASGGAYGLLVDRTIRDRAHQNGGSLEGGLRVSGTKGAVEFFLGFERRVDADPLELQPHTWTYVGFRLLSK